MAGALCHRLLSVVLIIALEVRSLPDEAINPADVWIKGVLQLQNQTEIVIPQSISDLAVNLTDQPSGGSPIEFFRSFAQGLVIGAKMCQSVNQTDLCESTAAASKGSFDSASLLDYLSSAKVKELKTQLQGVLSLAQREFSRHNGYDELAKSAVEKKIAGMCKSMSVKNRLRKLKRFNPRKTGYIKQCQSWRSCESERRIIACLVISTEELMWIQKLCSANLTGAGDEQVTVIEEQNKLLRQLRSSYGVVRKRAKELSGACYHLLPIFAKKFFEPVEESVAGAAISRLQLAIAAFVEVENNGFVPRQNRSLSQIVNSVLGGPLEDNAFSKSIELTTGIKGLRHVTEIEMLTQYYLSLQSAQSEIQCLASRWKSSAVQLIDEAAFNKLVELEDTMAAFALANSQDSKDLSKFPERFAKLCNTNIEPAVLVHSFLEQQIREISSNNTATLLRNFVFVRLLFQRLIPMLDSCTAMEMPNNAKALLLRRAEIINQGLAIEAVFSSAYEQLQSQNQQPAVDYFTRARVFLPCQAKAAVLSRKCSQTTRLLELNLDDNFGCRDPPLDDLYCNPAYWSARILGQTNASLYVASLEFWLAAQAVEDYQEYKQQAWHVSQIRDYVNKVLGLDSLLLDDDLEGLQKYRRSWGRGPDTVIALAFKYMETLKNNNVSTRYVADLPELDNIAVETVTACSGFNAVEVASKMKATAVDELQNGDVTHTTKLLLFPVSRLHGLLYVLDWCAHSRLERFYRSTGTTQPSVELMTNVIALVNELIDDAARIYRNKTNRPRTVRENGR